MNLGSYLENKDDKKTAKNIVDTIKSQPSCTFYFDPDFECNYFILENAYDYCNNEYVREIVDEKVQNMGGWIFVANLYFDGEVKRKKVLKVCWLPATDRRYPNRPAWHENVSQGTFNKMLYKRILNYVNSGSDGYCLGKDVEDHTIKYLVSRGLTLDSTYGRWAVIA